MEGMELDEVESGLDEKAVRYNGRTCVLDLLNIQQSVDEENFQIGNKKDNISCPNTCNEKHVSSSFQTCEDFQEAFSIKEVTLSNATSQNNNIVGKSLAELVTDHDFNVVDGPRDVLYNRISDSAENDIDTKSSESVLDIQYSDKVEFAIQKNLGLDSCGCVPLSVENISDHKMESPQENEEFLIKNDIAVTHTQVLYENHKSCEGTTLNTPRNYSNDCSYINEHENLEESLQIPFFDHINNETENIASNESDNADNWKMSPELPDFELLQLEASETSDLYNDFDVVELLKEIKYDLTKKDDESGDLGLSTLFAEPQSCTKNFSTGNKSRSVRKRKKQFLKLSKLPVASPVSGNIRRKFAQSFQELQSARQEFHDYNIDSKYTCPVCLEMYHMPNICSPCSHVFCDPCLRRMTGQGYEGIPCPLCRTVISSCQLDKEFDERLVLEYPEIYTARAMLERNTKFRHYRLPYTAPVPLGKRLMRRLIASRNIHSDTRWMSHDWFKFLLGCTVGMCISLLIMLFNRVKSVRDARDVNIVFLSILIGMSVTFLIFKHVKI